MQQGGCPSSLCCSHLWPPPSLLCSPPPTPSMPPPSTMTHYVTYHSQTLQNTKNVPNQRFFAVRHIPSWPFLIPAMLAKMRTGQGHDSSLATATAATPHHIPTLT